MMDDAFDNQTVAIIGIGLMGGSLALALTEHRACKKNFGD